MSIYYELKDKVSCPPGGFVLNRKDGSKFEGTYFASAVEEARRHFELDDEEAVQKVLHETYNNMPLDAREYFISKNTEALILQNPTFRYVDSKLLFPGAYHYNPGLIEHDGEDWLVYRLQQKNSDSTICRYSFKTGKNFKVELPYEVPTEQFEDPRVFRFQGKLHICYCSWRKTWTYRPLLKLFRLNDDWTVDAQIPLEYGGNGKGITQKNWQHFEHEGKLAFAYKYDPLQIIVGDECYTSKGLYWNFGQIRGGTPPLKCKEGWLTFFHSRTDIGRTKYHMGALLFSDKAPFTPIAMTTEPLMSGSSRDPNLSWAPLTVFPSGSILRKGVWAVAMGCNDLNCGLADYLHSDLLKLLKPV